ncbi:putative GTPase-activating protein [Encephalitozoon hellem ATCC 50504]|uniref:GTPase-activating protein GYP1 n=1 Tax=Encephalitozoon hellem TaxID=27973 RepID=A0A9Q9C9G4_ENCHE|nr:putative GTPase-activating protein [Encephalitozoon hellem ATCC 50504]AFM97944.1 putative GTPase-activating protein [Encephalitozoon hellem ATCC 50504]UTX42748.1 GTPase-activating protein GYP1 [Encephalitozoon hellem]WEL38207.1 Rab-GAP protein [Encephalitozoon hellem]|eukprot:XP_003886925.1 putative GTPase-activating protein [Encephalitozoon hellem ATCC 50504]
MNFHRKRERTVLHSLISKQINPTDSTPLDVCEIKKYCYYGFSNSSLRPKYWKVFLGYYSKNKFKTEMFLRNMRNSYSFYAERVGSGFEGEEECYKVIDNDVSRTFIKPRTGCGGSEEKKRYCEFLDSVSLGSGETHRDVIKRILKCYAMSNSSVRYVQGMNLILIAIYYVLCTSDDEDDKKHCEEDSFFCFNSLMVEIGDNFIRDLDQCSGGIMHRMSMVMEIVRGADEELYAMMRRKGLTEGGFHMKWILLMFMSCFEIEDVIWLWDRFLSDTYRFEMVLYCCASAIIIMRNAIIQEDFDVCMELLQKPSIVGVETMFNVADHLRRRNSEVFKDR